MKSKIKKYLNLVIKISVSLGALYFVFTKIDAKVVLDLYKKSNFFYIIIAILLFTLSKTIAAFRLNKFFDKTGIQLPDKTNLKLYILGMFYNLFLPGGIGGDGYKIFLLNRNFEVKAGKIFWAILIDRLSGMLAIFCLAVGLFSFLPLLPFVIDYRIYIWVLIPISLLVFYLIWKKYYPYFTSIFIQTTLQSFLVQITQTVCAYFILLALGYNTAIFNYILLFLISSIVATLPITIGGIGSRELTFLFGAPLLGLNVDTSIALSLMFYLITAFVSFFGIIYSINTKGLGLPATKISTQTEN